LIVKLFARFALALAVLGLGLLPRAQAGVTGTVTVVNNTGHTITIYLNDRYVGYVAGCSEKRFFVGDQPEGTTRLFGRSGSRTWGPHHVTRNRHNHTWNLLPPTPPAEQAELPRLRWAHSEGSFAHAGGSHWVERNDRGEVTFRFREERRTADYVELFDSSRDLFVRLYGDRMLLRAPDLGYADWTLFYHGGWAR
jgi:hypothetical protein